ncbi:unnamed protein product [Sphagnum jensenii]|uniref:Major capsid protein n=1 Tax=Sphagnum jensenii TaxID=128206 RepID=A0ABP0VC75_9BRYO
MGIPDHEKLRLNTDSGLYSQVKLWYYKRAQPSTVSDSLDCVAGDINDRATFDLALPFVASRTIQFSNSDLAQYTEDAIRTVKLGHAPSPFMEEVFKQIMIQCNAIAGRINNDLIGAVTFGVNVNSQSANSTVININKDATHFDLTQGIPALVTDALLNEFNGDLLIAGAGKMLAYEQFKQKAAPMLNGLDIANVGGYKFYKDFYAAPVWGAADAVPGDTVGVFAPGTIGLIDLNTLVGFREQNLGVFQAFQIPLPVFTSEGQSTIMMFDVRMRFNNCPSDIADAAYGGTRTISEGWSVQISKQYGLFQTPASLYGSGDRLAGSNGALRYNLTNNAV